MKETRKTFTTRLQNHFIEEDIASIMFAYDLSKEAHRTQKRFQGGRYFEHPRAGCIIMMDELELYNRDLLIAFLLHDVGEDTPLLGNTSECYDTFVKTIRFRLTPLFGPKVPETVIRVTKPSIDGKRFFTAQSVYDFYINEMRDHEQALIIKMIDRLHNLRTLPVHKPNWVHKQLRETIDVYLPMFRSVDGEFAAHAQALIKKLETEIIRLQASVTH